MSKREPDQTQENLRELLQRHWLHCQHLESERAQFMQVYAAVVAGIIVGYTYLISVDKPIDNYLILYILLFLVLLTFVGFFLTLRWVYSFECHREKVNEIAGILWRSCNVEVPLDPTMDIPSLHIMPPCWQKADGMFRTRYWFPLFYLFVLIGILALMNWPLKDYFPAGWHLRLECLDLGILAFAVFIAYRGFDSIRKPKTRKKVILAGCNGEWAQKHYLPLLVEKAKKEDITLWATDIESEIKLDSHGTRSLWQTAKSKGRACYLDMTKDVESSEMPWNVDYVFIVTPDRCHCEVAQFWLGRLSTNGKIFIEKPLDASIQAVEQLKTKIMDNNIVYGFDHYLAALHPFLRFVRSYSKEVDESEDLQIRILEDTEIPPEKADTLRQGMIFDLFPHILASSVAVAEKKLTPTEDTLRKVEFVGRARAKYKGWPFASETWACIKFLVADRRVTVTGIVGKGIGKTPDKRMTIYGAPGRKIEMDFQTYSFSVNGKPEGNLEPRHVESFLEAVLKEDNIDSAPGVLKFGAAFEILKSLSYIIGNSNMGPDYDIGSPAHKLPCP